MMDLFGKLGRVFPFWLFFCTQILASPPWAVHGKLQRSANGHYLQHEDGTPFLWMGDTGWGLFGHLDQAEVTQYLDQRQKTGFNVIQTVAYWYPHGGILPDGPHNPANAYGHRPFEGDADHPETSKPLIVADISPDRPDDYWDHADFIIRECKKRGLYLALLPCWGSAYIQSRRPGSRVEFTETEAREYGRFLGERYGQEPHMIWVLGGDIDPIHHGVGDQRMVYRAMAEGIGQAASNNPGLRWDQSHPDWDQTLMTFHAVQTPPQSRGGSSSVWFHQDSWLDLNMMETWAWTDQIYPLVRQDYQLSDPVKPTIMGEGAYEYGRYLTECGWVTPRRLRQQAYHTFFAGAAGFTYGAYPVWAMRSTHCGMDWRTALQLPGARQAATILRDFLGKYHWWEWQSLPAAFVRNPGEGETLQVAVKNLDRTGLVYLPFRDSVCLDLALLPEGNQGEMHWFRPDNGEILEIKENNACLIPPKRWEDAVLIIR